MELLSFEFSKMHFPYLSALLACIAAIINIGILFFIQYKLPRSKNSDIFSLIVAALVVWQIDDTILRLPVSKATAKLWDSILCFGWLSIAPLLLHFSFRFAQLKNLYSRPALFALYAPFAFFYVSYMLDLKDTDYVHDGNWGWIHMLRGGIFEGTRWFTIYLTAVASIFILVHHALFVETGSEKKKQALLISIGVMLPAIQIFCTQLVLPVLFSAAQVSMASSSFSLFSIATLIALKRYKLFNVSESVQSYPLLENLDKLVLVISPDKKIIYINRHASAVLGISQVINGAFHFQKIFPSIDGGYETFYNEVFAKVIHGQTVDNFPGTFITSNNETINVIVSSSPIINNHIQQGVLLVANNITPMVLALKDLELERLKKEKDIAEACLAAQEEERKTIGAELHDNVNQILASSLLYVSIMRREKNLDFAADIENLINSAIQEIRKLSHSLIAPSLEETELSKAVENILEITRKAGQLDIPQESISINESSLSGKMKLNVYRIIQEQLNNIIKYSRATSVKLNLFQESDKLFLKIVDDGVGFDTSSKSLGRGLSNMRNRARSNNGEMQIVSSPGKGCELSVVFENIA